MFGGGGSDEGEDKKNDESSEKATAAAKATAKTNPKSIFDIAALKEFGLSVVTLFIETIIIPRRN
jgi:hypothetical protein